MTDTSIAAQHPVDVSAAAEHYRCAVIALERSESWMEADSGWQGNLTGEERLAYRVADLAEAQVQATLAKVAAALLRPVATTVSCPVCRQPVTPNPDGSLPGHEISPGPRRSPICRFRGTVTNGAGG